MLHGNGFLKGIILNKVFLVGDLLSSHFSKRVASRLKAGRENLSSEIMGKKVNFTPYHACERLRFARNIHLDSNMLEMFEHAMRIPSIKIFGALCELYGLNPQDVLEIDSNFESTLGIEHMNFDFPSRGHVVSEHGNGNPDFDLL